MGCHLKVLYNYIRAKAAENDAADILQETMLGVWQGIGKFGGDSSFSTWVLAIARRKIADHYRRHYRRAGRETELSGAEQVETEGDGVAGAADRIAVQYAVAGLKEQDRELVYLIYSAGRSSPEVSRITGLPVGTIKSRMYAVRNRLRSSLGEVGT